MIALAVPNREWKKTLPPEPLGPGGGPYPAMYGRTDPKILDELVRQTASYWRGRENAVREMNPD